LLGDAPSEVHATNRALGSRRNRAASRRSAHGSWDRGRGESVGPVQCGIAWGRRPSPALVAHLSARSQAPPLRRRSPVRAVLAWSGLAVSPARTPLLGFIDAPSPRTPCCVHSRMEVSPSFGPGPACGSGRVPSVPFLPASTVCSAAGPTRVGSSAWRRFVAPCSRPWGSPCFRRRRRPTAVPIRGSEDVGPSPPPFPMASTLRSVLLAGSLAVVTARSSREELAFTDGRALSSLSRSRRAASPRCAGAGPRPQGFVPPESPFRPPDVSVGGRSMLPWALSAAARSPVARWLRRPQVTSKSESEDALSR
jgi:hypothetical protein